MNIGIDGRYIQDRYHGIGRYTFELLRQMVTNAPQHRYIVVHDPALANSRFDLRGLLMHPSVQAAPLRLRLYDPREQLHLRRLARRHALDVYHVPYFSAPLLLPCPVVLTIHDLILERFPASLPQPWLRATYRMLMLLGLRRARGVITVSAATKSDLLAHYRIAAERVITIGEAADAAYRPLPDTAIAAVRRKYALPDQFVLAVGVRRPHKNIGALVRALGRISGQVPHALVLVGGADHRFQDDVPSEAARVGFTSRVRDLGVVAEEDLPALYGAAAAYACPSVIEGFGLPILEALACGTPVVAGNMSSIPEITDQAAILCDPTDDVALAAALLRVLTDSELTARLRVAGIRQAATFSWPIAARATLGWYESLVGTRTATSITPAPLTTERGTTPGG